MAKLRYTMTITPAVIREIDEIARDNGLSRSALVEIYLREAIRRKKKQDASIVEA